MGFQVRANIETFFKVLKIHHYLLILAILPVKDTFSWHAGCVCKSITFNGGAIFMADLLEYKQLDLFLIPIKDHIMKKYARPFLKWAGGKGQLLEQFKIYFPDELNIIGELDSYYEPFLGSGAVFFWVIQHCKISKAYINEFNPEIYTCYISLQKDSPKVIAALQKLQNQYHLLSVDKQEELYYKIRNKYNKSRAEINFKKYDGSAFSKRAALTIFLNRTCFNGLYRVNSKGEFNVPFGRYLNPKICDKENLLLVSNLLQKVVITNTDFAIVEKQIRNIDKKSFVYFDPPYRPLNQTSNFNSYSANVFDDKEQERLAMTFKRLNKIGVKMMLSNSDPKNIDPNDNYFDKLYSEFKLIRLPAKRMINCQADKRGVINEILVTNYEK